MGGFPQVLRRTTPAFGGNDILGGLRHSPSRPGLLLNGNFLARLQRASV